MTKMNCSRILLWSFPMTKHFEDDGLTKAFCFSHGVVIHRNLWCCCSPFRTTTTTAATTDHNNNWRAPNVNRSKQLKNSDLFICLCTHVSESKFTSQHINVCRGISFYRPLKSSNESEHEQRQSTRIEWALIPLDIVVGLNSEFNMS